MMSTRSIREFESGVVLNDKTWQIIDNWINILTLLYCVEEFSDDTGTKLVITTKYWWATPF